MRLFADQEAIDTELAVMKSEIGPQLGLVSADVPLISNLDVWQNIALIYQYHRNVAEKHAHAFVLECLRRYGLENIADKRNPLLSETERFYVKIIRAAMVDNAVIVIDRPFKMLPYLKDTSFLYETLDRIGDLFVRCDIFDYLHGKNRYGMTDDSEA